MRQSDPLLFANNLASVRPGLVLFCRTILMFFIHRELFIRHQECRIGEFDECGHRGRVDIVGRKDTHLCLFWGHKHLYSYGTNGRVIRRTLDPRGECPSL